MKKTLALILALVLCLSLCACGGDSEGEPIADAFTKPDNYTMVMLVSINPQIRLYIDENGVVLAVEPVNDDAKKIIANIAFEDLDYQKVVSEFITVANSQGYIKNDAKLEFEVIENKNDKMDVDDVLNKSSESAKDTAAKLNVPIEVVSKPYLTDKMPDHIHSFDDATCTAPKTCKTCGATDGAANGHNWQDATCTDPKTCKTCGATDGAANGHNWQDATHATPKTCKTCGATDGAVHKHNWQDATCTAPKTCKTCGATDGAANGHNWKGATCSDPKTCKTCGATDGNALPHDYQNGMCGNCESCQFGYGKWQYFRVDGDVLYIVTLHGNDEGALTGISNSHYQDVDTMEVAKRDEYLQAGTQLVSYAGKSYLRIGGHGDPCFFEANGEVITVNLGEDGESCNEYITLQRRAKDQFAVKQVVGCTGYGIKKGAVFTKENNTKPSWLGNSWYAAVVSQNGKFAMEYRLDMTAQNNEFGGYPLKNCGGPRLDTIKEEYRNEYPVTFEVDGVTYGDNGDYTGVEFISCQVTGNTVILGTYDNIPSVALSWFTGNQYKVIAHINADRNTVLHGSLPVGTIFTLIEK